MLVANDNSDLCFIHHVENARNMIIYKWIVKPQYMTSHSVVNGGIDYLKNRQTYTNSNAIEQSNALALPHDISYKNSPTSPASPRLSLSLSLSPSLSFPFSPSLS